MIKPLPLWILTNKYPAIYEGESATAIEMVAKLYGKMEEMITDYNSFVTQINAAIAEYESTMNANFEDFKTEITTLVNNYIDCIDIKIANQDAKIANQDAKIAEAIQYMKDNIIQTATNIFNQALQDGEISCEFNIEYNAETEELIFTATATESEV